MKNLKFIMFYFAFSLLITWMVGLLIEELGPLTVALGTEDVMRMVREEFEDLMRQSMAAGTLKRPVAFETYVDESFVNNAQPVAIPL